MTHPPIAGVVFDMDGVLLDTERVYLEGFRVALATLGLPQDDDIYLRTVGTNRALSRQILTEGMAGRVTLEELDAVWDADIARRLAGGIPVKPGVTEVILALQQAGLPYIIATSTRTDKAHLHLERAGIGHLFPDIIGGDQVTASKPAPDIYHKATATLGLDPALCAGFEDSVNGVRASAAAGLVTVQVPDLLPADDEMRALTHHIADDLVTGARALGLLP